MVKLQYSRYVLDFPACGDSKSILNITRNYIYCYLLLDKCVAVPFNLIFTHHNVRCVDVPNLQCRFLSNMWLLSSYIQDLLDTLLLAHPIILMTTCRMIISNSVNKIIKYITLHTCIIHSQRCFLLMWNNSMDLANKIMEFSLTFPDLQNKCPRLFIKQIWKCYITFL